MIENKAKGSAENSVEETLKTKDFITFPKALDKVCTEEDLHKMMTSHNSDVPIEKVKFLDYPD